MPGDGIGAEVAESVKTVFKANNVPIEWEQVDVTGVESGDKHSEDLFRESIASLKRNKLGLKGTMLFRKVGSFPIVDEYDSRYPPHTSRALRTSILQRCASPRARHLRLNCSDQKHSRLQDPPRQRGPLHHT